MVKFIREEFIFRHVTQRRMQKHEGPVRVAEQRRSDRGIPRGLSELCATTFPLITTRFRKASSAVACRFE